MLKNLYLFFYYCFAQYLPDSYYGKIGRISNYIRVWLCKRIFYKCGNIRTINRKVHFGRGKYVEIGDDSGIGARTHLMGRVIIGKCVMISRDSIIWHRNHEFQRIDIPIIEQGQKPSKTTIIDDDVWIGMRCILTPGRHVSKGTIVAMGSVLTRDFPEYSIVGGNPAKLIKSRLNENKKTEA